MSFTRWLSHRLGLSPRPTSRRKTAAARSTFRPTLEALEDRWCPSTLTVVNNHDSGAGSLRADIAAAHSGDTIAFAPSLDGQTITLTSGELLIKQSLTIAGPGASQLTVSGNNASRVFEVSSSTKPQVTLSGLTISNGLAADGGGVLNGGKLTVSASILSGNNTVRNAGSSNAGGGIDNYGTLTITNSTLSNNTAIFGGGISNHTKGTLTVTNSTLSGNSTAADGEGGGINNYGTLTVQSGSILSNNKADSGAGICNQSGATLTVTNSSLSNNTANGAGGGITNVGSVRVSGSILSGNSAPYGGGIYDGAGTLTVTGCTLSGNVASTAGGGIVNSAGATVTVENSSSITGNTAPLGFGADVYNHGVLYWDLSSIIDTLDNTGTVVRI
jgi:hypothetical protein